MRTIINLILVVVFGLTGIVVAACGDTIINNYPTTGTSTSTVVTIPGSGPVTVIKEGCLFDAVLRDTQTDTVPLPLPSRLMPGEVFSGFGGEVRRGCNRELMITQITLRLTGEHAGNPFGSLDLWVNGHRFERAEVNFDPIRGLATYELNEPLDQEHETVTFWLNMRIASTAMTGWYFVELHSMAIRAIDEADVRVNSQLVFRHLEIVNRFPCETMACCAADTRWDEGVGRCVENVTGCRGANCCDSRTVWNGQKCVSAAACLGGVMNVAPSPNSRLNPMGPNEQGDLVIRLSAPSAQDYTVANLIATITGNNVNQTFSQVRMLVSNVQHGRTVTPVSDQPIYIDTLSSLIIVPANGSVDVTLRLVTTADVVPGTYYITVHELGSLGRTDGCLVGQRGYARLTLSVTR